MSLTNAPVLDTLRLTLAPPRPGHYATYRAFYDASDLTVGTYRGGRVDNEVRAILERDIDHWNAKGFGIWMIRLRGSETAVGGTGLSHHDNWPSHELTWWLLPEARGAGYATEASRAVIGWAYDVLGWSVVETHMRDENAPARRMAHRLGGRIARRDTFPDGVARDVFALPREARP